MTRPEVCGCDEATAYRRLLKRCYAALEAAAIMLWPDVTFPNLRANVAEALKWRGEDEVTAVQRCRRCLQETKDCKCTSTPTP